MWPVASAAAIDFLTSFYFGGSMGDSGSVARTGGLKKMVTENLGDIDARGINSIPLFIDESGREVVVRVGRYGPYLQRTLPGAETPVNEEGQPQDDRVSLPDGHRAGRVDAGKGRGAVRDGWRWRAEARRAPARPASRSS